MGKTKTYKPHGGLLEEEKSMSTVLEVHQKIALPPRKVSANSPKRAKKSVLAREAKAIGHLKSVERMSQAGENTSTVLVQLRAVEKEIVAIEKILLRQQATMAVAALLEKGDPAAADEVLASVDEALKRD
jgi:CsoR family transcriptional regulator, copper-sensing transcriptional repressor